MNYANQNRNNFKNYFSQLSKKIIPVLISSCIYNMQDLDFMFPFSIRYFLKTKELLKDEKKCMFLSEYKTQCFYV